MYFFARKPKQKGISRDISTGSFGYSYTRSKSFHHPRKRGATGTTKKPFRIARNGVLKPAV
jgi:hypothetical protein